MSSSTDTSGIDEDEYEDIGDGLNFEEDDDDINDEDGGGGVGGGEEDQDEITSQPISSNGNLNGGSSKNNSSSSSISNGSVCSSNGSDDYHDAISNNDDDDIDDIGDIIDIGEEMVEDEEQEEEEQEEDIDRRNRINFRNAIMNLITRHQFQDVDDDIIEQDDEDDDDNDEDQYQYQVNDDDDDEIYEDDEDDEEYDDYLLNPFLTYLNNNLSNNPNNNANKPPEIIPPVENQTINSRTNIRLKDRNTTKNKFLLNRELSDKYNENIRISQHYLPSDNFRNVHSLGSRIFCCKITNDGKRLMTASQDKKIRIFNTDNYQEIKSIDALDINWSIIDTDYSPDQNWLIYSSWSRYIQLCRVNYNVSDEFDDNDIIPKKNDIKSSSSSSIRGGIKQNAEDYHESLDLDPDFERFCVFGLKFSPNNKEILCGCSNGQIMIYDLEGRSVSKRFMGHARDINSVCYLDQSGNVFATGSDDSLIRVWDKRSLSSSSSSSTNSSGNVPVGSFTGHSQGITHVSSKDDGTYLLSNSKDQSAKLWDIRKMSSPTIKSPNNNNNINWDYRYYPYPSNYINAINSNNPSLNDVSLMTYRGHQVIQTLIRCYFSPIETTGQKYIYSGSFNGSIYIYDVLTGKLVKTLLQNNGPIRDLSWSPNSLNLISTNWNGKITSWSDFYDNRYPNESD